MRVRQAMSGEPGPFEVLIDCLKEDGLVAEAQQLNTLLREVAWTTGSEFLGEFGLKMKEIKAAQWKRMSRKTRKAFRSAVQVIPRAWLDLGLW